MISQVIKGLELHGWVQVPNLISRSELVEINHYIDQIKSEFVPALVGKGQSRQRITEVRGDFTHWIDLENPAKPILKQLKFLEELKQELNRTLYLGLKDHECHMALYPPGSFYKKHLDRFETDSSRSVSFIFYLHEEWKEGDGGELVLYDQQGEILETIRPEAGSFVCFISADFPHEVKPSRIERRSLTGWMHTKIIN